MKIFKDILYINFGSAVLFPIGMVTIGLTTRILGAEGFGQIALFLSLVEFSNNLIMSWNGHALMRYGIEELKTKPKLRDSLSASLFYSLCGTLMTYAGFALFFGQVEDYIGFSRYLWPLLILSVSKSLVYGLTATLAKITGNFKRLVILDISAQSIYCVALFLIERYTGGGDTALQLIIGANSLSFLATACVCLSTFRTYLDFRFRILKPMLVAFLKFGWTMPIAFFSSYLVDWGDLLIIRGVMGIKEAGIYQLSYKIMMIFSAVLMGLSSVLSPKIVNLRLSGGHDFLLKTYVGKFIPKFFLGWLILMWAAILVSPLLLGVISGEGFEKSGYLLQILLIGLASQLFSVTYTSLYFAYDLTLYTSVFNVGFAVANLSLDFVLIHWIGLPGVAIATSLSYTLVSLAYIVVFSRRMGTPYKKLMCLLLVSVLGLFLAVLSREPMVQLAIMFPVLILALAMGRQFGFIDGNDFLLAKEAFYRKKTAWMAQLKRTER